MIRLLLACLTVVSAQDVLNVKAWQSGKEIEYPESKLKGLMKRTSNSGISFSGGGSRSYVASIGYLGALHELGLMEDVRYITGISGGSWATAVYSYYNVEGVTDSDLLGEVLMPQDITIESLDRMNKNCARSFPNSTYKIDNYNDYFNKWDGGAQAIYLNPSNIKKGSPFSHNSKTVKDIKQRNPSLKNVDFITLRHKNTGINARPFPIISATLIGPEELLPFGLENRRWNLMEFTPLYVGVLYTQNVEYNQGNTTDGKIEKLKIGGLIEPFAFGLNITNSKGLQSKESHGVIELNLAENSGVFTDVAFMAAASSYYLGCAQAAVANTTDATTIGTVEYFSPAEDTQHKNTRMAIGDGGSMQNDDLISLLQRKVTNVVLFCSSSTILKSSDDWTPTIENISQSDIDYYLTSLFGVIPTDIPISDQLGLDLSKSQVFAKNELIPLIQRLQVAQKDGKGIIVESIHETVYNPYYGIKAGLKVNLLVVYLGKGKLWESQLNTEMQSLLNDPQGFYNLATFPNYPTSLSQINYQQANLLANYAGWSVLQNEELFRKVLSKDKSKLRLGNTNNNKGDVLED